MRRLLLLLTLPTIALCGPAADACRYNVRDIAFVDLREAPFVIAVSGPRQEAEALVNQLGPRLAYTNIAPQLDEDRPTASELACRLIAPDGRELEIPLPAPDADADLAATIESLVIGDRLARELQDGLVISHSTVLILAGSDPAANDAVAQQAEEAIAEVEAGRALWPKAIRGDVATKTLSLSERQEHRVLLWALGIDIDDPSPQVAVLFGRLRRLGEVLAAEQMAAGDLAPLLGVVSMDCECEYDIAPLVGVMAPHRWDQAHQQTASDALGFDPGHPLVLVEIEQIMARRDLPGVVGRSPLESGFGYQEIELPMVPPLDDEGSATATSELDVSAAASVDPPRDIESQRASPNKQDVSLVDDRGDQPSSVDSTLTITLALLLAAAVAGSLIVFWVRR